MITRSTIVRKRAPKYPSVEIQTPPPNPRRKNETVQTPTRTRLYDKIQEYGGRVPKETTFKKLGIAPRTGYRILSQHQARRTEKHRISGRPTAMRLRQTQAVKVAEDSSFRLGSAPHYDVAKLLGVDNGASERAIQNDMKDIAGQGTYTAAQSKHLTRANKNGRIAFCDEHPLMPKKELHRIEFSDEVGFGLGLQKRASVHRTPGKRERERPSKIQKRYSRKKQCFRVIGNMNWHKGLSDTILCKGTGNKDKMTPQDYAKLLREHLVERLREDRVLLEDNDRYHGNQAPENSHIRKTKRELKINLRANPRNSPDVNPIEMIWRCIKQRIKRLPPAMTQSQLWRQMLYEWNRVTLQECKRYIDELPSIT